jgi:hypothetical protein
VIYLMMALLEREVLLAGFRRLDERAAWVFGVIASLPLSLRRPCFVLRLAFSCLNSGLALEFW